MRCAPLIPLIPCLLSAAWAGEPRGRLGPGLRRSLEQQLRRRPLRPPPRLTIAPPPRLLPPPRPRAPFPKLRLAPTAQAPPLRLPARALQRDPVTPRSREKASTEKKPPTPRAKVDVPWASLRIPRGKAGTRSPRRSEEESMRKKKSGCPKEDGSPCLTREEAEAKVARCCGAIPSMDDRCVKLCSLTVKPVDLYRELTSKRCLAAQGEVDQYLACVTDSKDVRPCCSAEGVFPERLAEHCSGLCFPTGLALPRLHPANLPCVDKFHRIQHCFWTAFD